MIIAVIGGIIIGVTITAAPILYRRKRQRSKVKEKAGTPIVREQIEERTPDIPQRTAPIPHATGWSENAIGLDEAVQGTVVKGLMESGADIDITLDFPERFKLFGQPVASRGTVTIHRKDDQMEAVRVLGRHVNEVEAATDERLKELEAVLGVKAKKDTPTKETIIATSGDDEGAEEAHSVY